MGEQQPDRTQGKTQDPNKIRSQTFISRKPKVNDKRSMGN